LFKPGLNFHQVSFSLILIGHTSPPYTSSSLSYSKEKAT
jgi:hypothetical protein